MQKGLSVKVLGSVSPYCKGDKNCPGFLLEYDNRKIMFDCGNGTSRLLNFPDDLNNLTVLISHLHPDHYGDILNIAQAAYVFKQHNLLKNNIKVYIPCKDIQEGFGQRIMRFEGFYTEPKTIHIPDYVLIKKLESFYPVEVIGYDHISINEKNFSIRTEKVSHPVYSYAFRMDTEEGSIVYSSDTGPENNLIEFATGADLFICESTFLIKNLRINNDHLYTIEAAHIAKAANVKKLLLTHFWPEFPKELYLNEAKQIFENTEVAEEGKKLLLKKKK